MRFGCLGIVIAVGLLWGGGQMAYVGFSNRTITEISIDELIEQKPTAKWLRVTDGQIDLLNCVYKESISGEPKELYLPVVSKNAEGDDPLHVIYHTKEPEYFETFRKLQAIGKDESLSQAEVLMKMAELSDQLFQEKSIEGTVEFGIDSDSGDNEARELFDNLAPAAIMIEAGGKPSLWGGLAMLGIGLVIGVFTLGGLTKKSS